MQQQKRHPTVWFDKMNREMQKEHQDIQNNLTKTVHIIIIII